MRYFYDCEFIEDGQTIDLISIGIATEDGRELCLQSMAFNPQKASDWVKEHVFPQLWHCPYQGSYDLATMLKQHKDGQCLDQMTGFRHRCPWRNPVQMRRAVKAFFNPTEPIELWGYYSAYDHVAFCQLFGRMVDLPKGFPMYTRDIKQWSDMLGGVALPEQEVNEHHALADARWNRLCWQTLQEYQEQRS